MFKIPLRQFHIVKHDENIREIAKIYNIHLQLLLRENNILKGARIIVGQFIKIPKNNEKYEKLIYVRPKQRKFSNKNLIRVQNNKEKKIFFKNLTPLNNKNYVWPLQGSIIKRYGNHNGKLNDAVNIAAPKGSKILATTDGKIIFTGYKPSTTYTNKKNITYYVFE